MRTVTDMLNDCIGKLFREELNTVLEPQTGHTPEVFLVEMEGVGTFHVCGSLHIDASAGASRHWRPA